MLNPNVIPNVLINTGTNSVLGEGMSADLLSSSVTAQNLINKYNNKMTEQSNPILNIAGEVMSEALVNSGVPAPLAEAAIGYIKGKAADIGASMSSGNGSTGNGGGVFNVNSDLNSYLADSAKYQFAEPSEPVPITLKTNIKPNHYKHAWNNGGDPANSHPDLNVAKFNFRIFGSDGTPTRKYAIFGPITNIQLQLARRLNFAVNATDSSTANLISYFTKVNNALMAYYHYDSIINFASNPYNRNSGVAFLRNGITYSELQNLQFIKNILLTFPIPPKMVDLAWYLSQFYRSSEVNSSTLIKCLFFNPVQITLGTAELAENNFFAAGTDLTTMLNDLVALKNTANLIAKAFPEWAVSSLPGSMNVPLFDDQFNTFWSNSPETLSINTNSTNYPFTATNGENIQYSAFVEEVDGLLYPLTSISDNSISTTGDDKWSPGFIIPRKNSSGTSFSTNRMWYDVTLQCFRGAYVAPRVATASGFTYVSHTGTVTTTIPFKAEQILGVSINTLNDTSEAFLDYMFQYNVDGNSSYNRNSLQDNSGDLKKPKTKGKRRRSRK